MHYVRGVAYASTNVTTIAKFAKNCTMGITVLLCAWLHCAVFQTIFFLLSVWRSLEKRFKLELLRAHTLRALCTFCLLCH